MSELNGYTTSPFLGDGYDECATVPAHPGKWPECKIWYRCITAVENSEVLAKARLHEGTPMVKHWAELFATKIQKWELRDRDAKPVPVTAENIGKLSPLFYDVLHSYLDGTLPSDTQRESLEAELKNLSAG